MIDESSLYMAVLFGQHVPIILCSFRIDPSTASNKLVGLVFELDLLIFQKKKCNICQRFIGACNRYSWSHFFLLIWFNTCNSSHFVLCDWFCYKKNSNNNNYNGCVSRYKNVINLLYDKLTFDTWKTSIWMNCDLKSLNHIFINRSVNFFNLPTTKMKVMWKYLMNCSASLGKHIQELLKLWTITFNTSLVCKWMGIRSEKQWTDDNKYVVVFIGVTVVAGVFQSIFCPILAKMMKID